MQMRCWQLRCLCSGNQRTGQSDRSLHKINIADNVAVQAKLVISPIWYTICKLDNCPSTFLSPLTRPQVTSTMRSSKYDSILAEYITEEDVFAESFQQHQRRPSVSPAERNAILQNTIHELQKLRLALAGNTKELARTNELLEYVQRLQGTDPPASQEEQFNHMYYLRKWAFWVPPALLQQQGGIQGPVLATIAHYYSTIIELEPLFPDLGSAFVTALALPALEATFSLMGTLDVSVPANQETLSMMQHPQNVALSYRSRTLLGSTSTISQMPVTTISADVLSYTSVGNISPAFMPSPLHSPAPQSAGSYAFFLNVPSGPTSAGFDYGMQDWGVVPSPAFPATPAEYGVPDDHSYVGFRAGLVSSPVPVWM